MTDATNRLERDAFESELRRRFLSPALGVLAIVFAAALSVVLWVAQRQDELAASQIYAVAESLIRQQRDEIGRLTLDYSWWDAAV